MAKILIDGKDYEVRDGRNLLETCLEQGIDLPYFCWHPAMGSVGACRQCAVKQFKDEKDTRGKIVMACMTPASDGARFSVEDQEARTFRKSVIEWLMLNHPHDCPICDEGGECHLQDMTLMTGHVYRRTRFKKRTFRNQNLGPFVNHEMNRCIACYRCVRFYRDYAGGRDFDAFAAHDHVYFGRHEDGTLESEFSGNLVEVCPTGVFDDKTLKEHYTRKWDLQTAPGICAHCGLGCNTIPGERYGSLRRIRNRYHEEINGYFLCDRGRYGYEFVNGEKRIREPWMKGGGDARNTFQALLGNPQALERTIGIGSPRASLESNFVLKSLVGNDRFYAGFSDREASLVDLILRIMKSTPARIASVSEIERADAILVMGEDLPNTAPRLALALRQAAKNAPMERVKEMKIPDWLDGPVRETIQNEKSPIFLAVSHSTRIDDLAARTYFSPPQDVARLGFAIAHLIDPAAPDVDGLSDPQRAHAQAIASALLSASAPALVSGTGSESGSVIEATANIAAALVKKGRKPRLSFVVPECNSAGLGLLGGKLLSEAFEAARDGKFDTAIVIENDLFRRAPSDEVRAFLKSVRRVILIDTIASAMIPVASMILPAASFAESSGTYVNNEGRAQRFFRVLEPPSTVRESWRWIRKDEFLDAILSAMSVRGVIDAAPGSSFRMNGERVPRQPHRYSGRTAMHANVSVFEPMPSEDQDSPLSFSMEGSDRQPPPSLIPRFWAPGWNSIQSLNRFQSEIGGSLRGGPSGVRLIEQGRAEAEYFSRIPRAFVREPGKFLAVPLQHVFGSDETSALGPAVRERVPVPYAALSASDAENLAARLQLHEGDETLLSLFPDQRGILVRIDPSLPAGVVGIPVGLPGLPFPSSALPAWCEFANRKMRGAA